MQSASLSLYGQEDYILYLYRCSQHPNDSVSNLYVWYNNVRAYPQSVWSRGLRESRNECATYGSAESEISRIGNVTSDASRVYRESK